MWIKADIPFEQTGGGACGAVFEGDALALGGTLSPFMGQAALVYMDPPYLTGDRFTYRQRVGTKGFLTGKPEICLPAYSDKFESRESYMAMLRGLCTLGRDLLKDTGTLFLHLDYRMGAYAKIMLDDLFGESSFTNEIIWAYETGGRATRHFSRKHDVILMYRKTPKAYFDITQVPMSRKDTRHNHMKKQADADGRLFYTIRTGGKTYTYYEDAPVYPSDVWTDLNPLQQKDPERSGYDTQKPLSLLARILRSASQKGDLVADLCFGSGTTLVCAAQEGRRFLGVDASQSALSAASKRLMGTPYTLTRAADLSPATLEATLGDEVCLESFSFDNLPPLSRPTYTLAPLDLIDQWAVGVVSGGVFHASAWRARTKAVPDLPQTLNAPEANGQTAIAIIDVLARKHVFVWNEC